MRGFGGFADEQMHVMGHDHIRVRALRAVAKTLASSRRAALAGEWRVGDLEAAGILTSENL